MSCREFGHLLVMCNYSDMYFKIQKSLDCDCHSKSKRKAMNRNWSNQKANPALNTKAGNK